MVSKAPHKEDLKIDSVRDKMESILKERMQAAATRPASTKPSPFKPINKKGS